MANIESLEHIASGGVLPVEGTDDILARNTMKKSDDLHAKLVKTYGDDKQRVFDEWVKGTDDYVFNNKTVDHYWDTYEKLYPGTPDEYKESLRSDLNRQLSVRPYEVDKEFYLRDRLTKLPSWAQDEYGPQLNELSARAASANVFKASTAFRHNLIDSLGRMTHLDDLDPDVSEETHIADVMRLVELDLFQNSSVLNGRLAVSDSDGNVLPAYDLTSRRQVYGEGDVAGDPALSEVEMIHRIAPDIVTTAVRRRLAVSRGNVKEQNLLAENIIERLLEEGQVPREQWGSAFSSITTKKNSDLIGTAIAGEVKSGRLQSDQDIARSIYEALTEYGELDAETS